MCGGYRDTPLRSRGPRESRAADEEQVTCTGDAAARSRYPIGLGGGTVTPRAGVTPSAPGPHRPSPSSSSPCPLLPALAWSPRAQRVRCAASCFLCTFPFCKHHLCFPFLPASLPGAFRGHRLCGLSGAHAAPSPGTLQDAFPHAALGTSSSRYCFPHKYKGKRRGKRALSHLPLALTGRNARHKRF